MPPWCKRLLHGSTRSTGVLPRCPWLSSTSLPSHGSWVATRPVPRYHLHLLPSCNLSWPPRDVSACWTQQHRGPPAPPCSLLSQHPQKHPDLGPIRSGGCHATVLAAAAVLRDEKRQHSPITRTLHRIDQPGHRKTAGSPLLPSGLRMVLTFCKKAFSTKAGGGQLIPTVRSLLSTSNMMASYWAGAAGGSAETCCPTGERRAMHGGKATNGVVKTSSLPLYGCFALLGFLFSNETQGSSPWHWGRQQIQGPLHTSARRRL